MLHLTVSRILPIFLCAGMSIAAVAQGPPNRGPARVAVAPGKEGVIRPQAEFAGTVYYKEVSDVASGAQGKVGAVLFEEGQRVKRGQILVRLDDELLRKDLQAFVANKKRFEAERENARRQLSRSEALAGGGLATQEALDEIKYRLEALEHQVASAAAGAERIEAQIARYTITAPFDGVVLERNTDLGEWKSEGETVGVVARDGIYDVVIDLPEQHVAWIDEGADVALRIGGEEYIGSVAAVIPRGDAVTRTFPVRIRVEPETPLYEGMAAVGLLPTGDPSTSILVPRDAVFQQGFDTVVFSVNDNVAQRHLVEVIGYDGGWAGIDAPNVAGNEMFVVAGQERLRDGESVEIVERLDARQTSAD